MANRSVLGQPKAEWNPTSSHKRRSQFLLAMNVLCNVRHCFNHVYGDLKYGNDL